MDLQLEKTAFGIGRQNFRIHQSLGRSQQRRIFRLQFDEIEAQNGGKYWESREKAKATDNGVEWQCDRLRLPVRRRYMSRVVIEFRSRGARNKADTRAILLLPNIVDNETLNFKLPIYNQTIPED